MPAPKLLELPPPVAASWQWQIHGACRDADGALFFHPDNERGQARENRVAAAKDVCARCPVRARCLRYALESGERYGIWGGLTEEERAQARRARRGRRSR
ncbi:WhiB family transcriptional regulator [Rhodococcus sp. CH91]|uniref:WhiB family transcriptional regulator n=1 Tax=Rhodococcus sp. CH91 TaxID=2910256 RepID=UPI001F4AE4AA|nr:WhiB family transcriptional regulator [Rhodococcus sp. CH91]